MAVTNTLSSSLTSTTTASVWYGVQIRPNKDVQIVSAEVDPACNATTCYLYTTDGTKLAEASFTDSVATFATPEDLTSGTTYYILAGSGESSYTIKYASSVSFPIDETDISFLGEVNTSNQGSTFTTATTTAINFYNVVTQMPGSPSSSPSASPSTSPSASVSSSPSSSPSASVSSSPSSSPSASPSASPSGDDMWTPIVKSPYVEWTPDNKSADTGWTAVNKS